MNQKYYLNGMRVKHKIRNWIRIIVDVDDEFIKLMHPETLFKNGFDKDKNMHTSYDLGEMQSDWEAV